jgi:hypothetical protein
LRGDDEVMGPFLVRGATSRSEKPEIAYSGPSPARWNSVR